MNITDELREYIKQTNWAMTSKAKWFAIADRIDIEHEKAIRELNNLADAIADSCVQLPKDANGEYIHIGDVMENLREDFEPPFHHTFRVYGIQYRAYGQECTLTEDGYPSIQYRASEVRHYHEPTIEDVLREFALEIDPSADIAVTGAETIKKFAAKLQLRRDGE